MKKIFLILSIMLFSFYNSFADDVILNNEYEEDFGSYSFMGKKYVKPTNFEEFITSLDFTLNLSNAINANFFQKMNDSIVSGPSNIVYPVTIGLLIPNYTFFSMQPELSFYSMYHLWYEGMALPAEIENRTTNTLSFLLNVPVVISFFFEKNRMQLKAGLGLMMRFGLIASGVPENEKNDVENINSWFWQNGRFIYLTSGISWLFDLAGNTKIGPEFNIDVPVGTIFSGEGLQGLVSSIGLKISL